MDPRRIVPNPLALSALAWLHKAPMHPYELARRLEDSGQDRWVKFTRSSLYMVIDQLAKAGFIAAQGVSRVGQRPQRKTYEITQAGRDEFDAWIRDLLARPRDDHPQFAVALSLLSLLDPVDAVALLRDRVADLARRAQDWRDSGAAALAQGTLWIFLVEEHYAASMLEAEIAYVEELIGSLSDPAYGDLWRKTMEGRG